MSIFQQFLKGARHQYPPFPEGNECSTIIQSHVVQKPPLGQQINLRALNEFYQIRKVIILANQRPPCPCMKLPSSSLIRTNHQTSTVQRHSISFRTIQNNLPFYRKKTFFGYLDTKSQIAKFDWLIDWKRRLCTSRTTLECSKQ